MVTMEEIGTRLNAAFEDFICDDEIRMLLVLIRAMEPIDRDRLMGLMRVAFMGGATAGASFIHEQMKKP
jgi:hypothetical protein